MTQDNATLGKEAAATAAAALVKDGMTIGLGTGSTAALFIHALIKRIKNENLRITAMPTSVKSAEYALAGGIPLCDIKHTTSLDIDFDGADKINRQKQMIKGGGGALLREKIVAKMSREMVVIIDESKLCDTLGHFPLPVEIAPFAPEATRHALHQLGYEGKIRIKNDGAPYITDNGNYIIDITKPESFPSPETDDARLRSVPGVLETGFFLNLAGRVLIGHANGTVKVMDKPGIIDD